MVDYVSRVVDAELRKDMTVMGAMLIEGPKAVGKTHTAAQLARTTLRMDVDASARMLLGTDPSLLFAYDTPILFDEWQEAPELWNLVRRAVDDHDEKGQYLLTGSATPRDAARMHSGAGRIGRLRMRPMSLLETGHSTGEVSLAALLAGETPSAAPASLTVRELLQRVVTGGWPDAFGLDEARARRWLRNYVDNIVEVDVPSLGPRRNPGNLRRLLASLGRAAGTSLNRSALEIEVGGEGGPVAAETITGYLDALERLMLIEPLPAWRPHMRSRAQLRTSAVHHFVDPALGLAALRVGTNDLLHDLNAAGLQFESLVVRELRVYAQALGASLSSWRDTKANREVDVILELPDGRWAAVEIKLGEGATDAAAASLRTFAAQVDTKVHGEAAALIVVNGGRFTYRRPDGVVVVPVSTLGP